MLCFLTSTVPPVWMAKEVPKLMLANPQAKVVMISSEHNGLREREAISFRRGGDHAQTVFPEPRLMRCCTGYSGFCRQSLQIGSGIRNSA